MPKVTKTTELWCNIPNHIGVVAGITRAIAETRTNILATASWVSSTTPTKGYYKMVTTNNPKAATALKNLGYDVKKTDVLVVDLPNRSGSFYPVAQRIAEAGININYHYATTTGPKGQIILSTNNNNKAMQLIRQCRT